MPFEGISSSRCGSLSRGKGRFSVAFISQPAVLFVYMFTIVEKKDRTFLKAFVHHTI